MLPDALLDRDLLGQSRRASRKSLYSSKAWLEKLDLTHELTGHQGCVNTLSWSQGGEYLVSGSDDHRLYIWSTEDKYSVRKTLHTGHSGNIFSAKFMPHTNNSKIVSCAGDRLVKLSEVEYSTPSKQAPGSTKRTWYCHSDMTKRIVTEDNPNTFLTCSEDGDVRHHDLRISHLCPARPRACPPPLISYGQYHIQLTTLTMTKANPMYLIVGGSHPHAFLHDRRMVGRDLQREWGNRPWKVEDATQIVRRFSPHGKPPTPTRSSVHITACKFSEARPDEFVGSWSGDSVYMFNIHDSPVPPLPESSAQTKSAVKPNPAESTTARGKRKRTTARRDDDQDGHAESSASSIDTDRKPPALRESSASAETSSSLAGMSSATVRPESIASNIASDAMGRQLTAIRRLFFTPANECTQQTFLIAHESVVSLLSDMRLAMYSASPEFIEQRQETMRFVTCIGIVCRVIALRLEWPDPAPEILLQTIVDWDRTIPRSWDHWIIQFIRIVICWFEATISPNNALRELTQAKDTVPDSHLVAVGGESLLFDSMSEMLDSFVHFIESTERTEEQKRFWILDVLRACILLLGEGIDFAFVEGAFATALDDDELGEAAETLLEAFEVPTITIDDDEDDDEEEDHEEDEEDEEDEDENESEHRVNDDDDNDDDVEIEEEDEEDSTFILRYGDGEDGDDDMERAPFLIFRRGGLNRAGRQAAKDVPIVNHRKAYSGHCNVETVKDVNYFGLDDEYVMSGSDDGILFIWDRKTSGIVQLLKADTRVTNVMTGHPYHPVIAASGIDNTVKIFSPEGLGKGLTSRQSLKDEYKVRSRNDVHRRQGLPHGLPGTFIDREMLAAFFNLRAARRRRENDGSPEGCETM